MRGRGVTGGRSPRARSAPTIALGTFLVLAAGAMLLVLAAGDRAPLWMIGAWLVIALAAALLVGALVPSSDAGETAGAAGTADAEPRPGPAPTPSAPGDAPRSEPDVD